jgi:hypothetical protein
VSHDRENIVDAMKQAMREKSRLSECDMRYLTGMLFAVFAGNSFAADPPLVLGVTPSSGLAGTPVSVTGSNFTGATAIAFGPASAPTFTVNSDTSITVIAPPAIDTVHVIVVTPVGISGTTAADQFTYDTTVPVRLQSFGVD